MVATEAQWPGEAWGMQLGQRVSDIRRREDYAKHHPERRAELNALVFRWNALAW